MVSRTSDWRGELGVRFGCVLADAGYGLSAPFRQGLTARKLAWAVGIPRHLKVYPADVRMIWPVAKRGRPRQRHIPDILSIPAEDMLANAKWHTIGWRTGTKGKLKARFASTGARLLVQLSGRNSRNASMTGTSPRASVSDTRVWQFAVLPSAEAYCAATPTECVPFLAIAVSSITSTASLPPTSLTSAPLQR